MKKPRKIIYSLLIIILLAVFLYSAYQIAAYIKEGMDNRKLVEDLKDLAVVLNDPSLELIEPDGGAASDYSLSKETEADAEVTKNAWPDAAPIKVDFELLKQTNDDIRAWLYCEDTMINYPVAQGEDNDYYLYRLLNGSYNRGGTLFMECSNQSDFSDWNTLIYGHNMKNNTMFGTLTDYNSQEYYDKHPIWYLMTPDGDYRIELIAGFVTNTTSEIYTIPQTMEEKDTLVQSIMRRSTFATDAEIASEDRLITFSTCTYEYADARYVLVGILKKL